MQRPIADYELNHIERHFLSRPQGGLDHEYGRQLVDEIRRLNQEQTALELESIQVYEGAFV